MATDRLNTNKWLKSGKSLVSNNGYHKLVMQNDGNLVLYSLGVPIWNSNTWNPGKVEGLVMQGDGNLVMYSTNGQPVWSSDTRGSNAALIMQDDRNLVVYTRGHATWASNTATPPEYWEPVKDVEIPPRLLAQAKADPKSRPFVANDNIIVCSSPPAGPLVCVAALITLAVLLEFRGGNPPFGENNDIRVAGRKFDEHVLQPALAGALYNARAAGRSIDNFFKDPGGQVSKEWKKIFGL